MDFSQNSIPFIFRPNIHNDSEALYLDFVSYFLQYSNDLTSEIL